MIVYTEFALVVEKYSHAPRIWSKGTKIDLLTPQWLMYKRIYMGLNGISMLENNIFSNEVLITL